MTGAALEEHVPVALRVARDFYLPGGDRQDVEQEARIALWLAARTYNGQGSFAGWATFVVRRTLITKLRSAQREKHRPLTEALRTALVDDGEKIEEVPIVDTIIGGRDPLDVVIAREQLAAVARAIRELTPLERAALDGVLAGVEPRRGDHRLDNSIRRARKKIRAAIAA